MINIRQRIALVEELTANGDVQSLSYAALECRLTIEQICYERLLISHDYIARADLKKWTPAQVVKQVSEEANENIASGLTISISKEPIEEGKEPKTQADYESMEYVKLGEQVGFKINELHRLWQGLSNVALHINLPEEKQPLSMYGNPDAIKRKVAEAVALFKKFEPGTLIMGAMAGANSFACLGCGTLIRRNADLLKAGQVINCFNPSCDETYTASRDDDEITYARRSIPIVCKACLCTGLIPMKAVEKLRFADVLSVTCVECGQVTQARLQLAQEKVSSTG